ncbi:MAG: hypothetical protein ACRECW_07125 [Phyllobacterium sp.]
MILYAIEELRAQGVPDDECAIVLSQYAPVDLDLLHICLEEPLCPVEPLYSEPERVAA